MLFFIVFFYFYVYFRRTCDEWFTALHALGMKRATLAALVRSKFDLRASYVCDVDVAQASRKYFFYFSSAVAAAFFFFLFLFISFWWLSFVRQQINRKLNTKIEEIKYAEDGEEEGKLNEKKNQWESSVFIRIFTFDYCSFVFLLIKKKRNEESSSRKSSIRKIDLKHVR